MFLVGGSVVSFNENVASFTIYNLIPSEQRKEIIQYVGKCS